ncbi:hypothetical protein BsWGS_13105 [Bradybaena similaris]
MASFVQWCVVGLLAVVGLQGGNLISASRDIQCKSVTIESTRNEPTRKEIKDNNFIKAEITFVNNIESLGDVECKLGTNIFWTADYIYVDDGCKAKLDVCYKSVDQSTLPAGCKYIQLLSRYRREDTEEFAERIDYIELEDQHGDKVQCVKDQNFGARGKVAFANDGCRGRFRVCFKGAVSEGDDECDYVRLKSTRTEKDQFTPTDDDGQLAPIVSVQLDRELRNSTGCKEWRTFTFSGNVVTARRGCRGRFKVCYRKRGSDTAYSFKGCITVYLRSKLNEVVKKRITDDDSKIRSLELSSQDEDTKCVRDLNYGIKDGGIYASGGCKGYFTVCATDSNLPERPKSACIRVNLESWSPKETDWTRVTSKDGHTINITKFELIKEFSKDACEKDKTYFTLRNDEIHATDGCRARIRVCYELKN